MQHANEICIFMNVAHTLMALHITKFNRRKSKWKIQEYANERLVDRIEKSKVIEIHGAHLFGVFEPFVCIGIETCKKESAVMNTITSDLGLVWTEGRYASLRNFYFIALYYNLIWICQVNYHDFRLDVVHSITFGCQLKPKLHTKRRIGSEKWRNATSQCRYCVVRALTHHHCSLYF